MNSDQIVNEYVLPIGFVFLLAWFIHSLSPRVAKHLMSLSGYAPERLRRTEERRHTLKDLLASTISFIAFLFAILFTLGQFIDTTTLVWMIGLFSAAFGLGARPLISDFLTGISFLFENTLDVGEKVEIMGIEGVVEKINLRTLFLRAPTGELFVIPNGEVRIIRNFSRGLFSTADVVIKIDANHLSQAIALLEKLGEEAVTLLPNLVDPWQVINTSGLVGEHTELRLLAKARFGQAATMRPRLLGLVHERLAEASIEMID